MGEEPLAPELARVLDSAQTAMAVLLGRNPEPLDDVWPRLASACQDATDFYGRTESLLEQLPTGPDDPRTSLVEEIRQALGRGRSTLAAVLEAVNNDNVPMLQGTITALEESIGYLQECTRTLQRIERQTPTGVPYAALDALIGALRAEARDRIELPLAASVALVERFRRQVALFGVIHSKAASLAQEASVLLATLEGGIGAAAHYRESGQGEACTDAMRFLSRGSWPLAGVFQEMDRVAAESHEFSRHAALEDCCRYLNLQREIAPERRSIFDQATLERADGLCQSLADQWASYRRLPLAFVLSGPLDAAESGVRHLQGRLQQFQGAIVKADASALLALCTLRDAADTTVLCLQDLRRTLKAQLDLTEPFPRLELLRERIGRLLQGTISNRRFLLDFSGQAGHLEELYQQARSSVQGAALASALAEQRQGFEEIAGYFDDRDPEHLTAGWRQIEKTLPALKPLLRTLPQHSFGRGLSDSVPDLLVRLTEWRTGVEKGDLSAREARSRVKDEIRRLNDLRQEARSRFAHLVKAGAAPAVQLGMQSYLENMTHLTDALHTMELQLGNGVTGLHDGFEQARHIILAMEMQVHQSGR